MNKINLKSTLMIVILLTIFFNLNGCEIVKITKSGFFIEYPRDGANDVPLNLKIRINDTEYNKAVTYDVYLNGELVFDGANATEITIPKKLDAGEKYVLLVVKKVLKRKVLEKDVSMFRTTKKPVFVYLNPYENSEYYEGMKFEWKAVDPDGDKLKFDVYLAMDEESYQELIDESGGNITTKISTEMTKVASDLEENSYKPDGLIVGKKYRWLVIAKDDKGATSSSNESVFSCSSPPYEYKIFTFDRASQEIWGMKVEIGKEYKIEPFIKKSVGRINLQGMVAMNGKLYVQYDGSDFYIYNADDLSDYKFANTVEEVEDLITTGRFIMGYGRCYFVYDTYEEKKVLDKCSGNPDVYYYIGYTGSIFLVVEITIEYGEENKYYSKVYVYDGNYNLVEEKNCGEVGFDVANVLVQGRKMYLLGMNDGGTYLYVYDLSNINDFCISRPEDTLKLSNSAYYNSSGRLSWVIFHGKNYILANVYGEVYLIDPENMRIEGYIINHEISEIKYLDYSNYYILLMGYNRRKGFKLNKGLNNEMFYYDPNNGIRSLGKIVNIGNYIFVANNEAFNSEKEIAVFDSNLNLNGFVGFEDPSHELNMFEEGTELIVHDNEGVKILDVSTPLEPEIISKIDNRSIDFYKMFLYGNYIYFYKERRLTIYDISIESTPVLVADKSFSFEDDNANYLGGNNNFLVLAPSHSYYILDITDKKNPKIIVEDNFSLEMNPIIIGDYVYLIGWNSGNFQGQLIIYDLSNLSSPQKYGPMSFSGDCVNGSYALYNNYLVLGCRNGIWLYDISDIISPKLLGGVSINYVENIKNLEIIDDMLYITSDNGIHGIQIDTVISNVGQQFIAVDPDYFYTSHSFYKIAVKE